MSILGYPAHPEHDPSPAAEVVFGVPRRSIEPLPVPLRLLADFPPVFLDHVRSGDWPLYAMPFDGTTHAVVCSVEIKRGERPVFFVDDSLIEGSATVRAALRVLVDRVLDTDTEHECYMRLPAAADRAALTAAQRAEYGLDDLDMSQAFACPDCGHLPGCGCDCCPYDLPAVAGAEQLVGGAR
jgi:hypothetical protein